MSDVKVTREHRLAALRTLGWSEPTDADPWLDVGGDTLTHANKYIGQWVTSMVEESAVAHAIATAEHRVRAAVIVDLRGLVERACAGCVGQCYVNVNSIELLIETLEAQQ
jgi:hypothetical protein